ncbi:precorrin-4 C(11)-methyltransferase [Mobilicoccus pelagius]|uniref:Precorrin-4 C11-methyltransferase n=1 Tax=Mobilicoccus pelagius NBRC 104925 TaxID=1089455 RepID=H5UUX6_9MICO|nr:precorrin-4 C(11)-methyltransferase [Mobilicoccus pelagius]GAB49534.1 precorrin-4 C11-methyltransferase [Mobilicoccus pelagius NBRC 104925]
MTVHFIGAGPGAADLLTLRAVRILESSPVCLYAGALVPPEVLDHCPPGARLVDTADLDLEAITAELVAAHERGEDVARLQSGDLSVYSAVSEQIRRLEEAGVPYSLTPGVPAFAAAAASLGQELTVPTVGQTIILTRASRNATTMPPGEELDNLARTGALLVLHLATNLVEDVVETLLPHYGEDCPAAVVAMASRDDEVVARCRLADLATTVRGKGIRRTALLFVGRALEAGDFEDSHLYSTACAAARRDDPLPPPLLRS